MLLIHTQAFEIGPDGRGLGCDSQPAQRRSKVWAPGQGRPSPSVPSECGQQDPRSGGDESPPALPRRRLIVYVRAQLLGRSPPPHPSSVVISAQQQPGQLHWPLSEPIQVTSPVLEGAFAFRALWQLSFPVSERAVCERRKLGCEGSRCFHRTNRDEGRCL